MTIIRRKVLLSYDRKFFNTIHLLHTHFSALHFYSVNAQLRCDLGITNLYCLTTGKDSLSKVGTYQFNKISCYVLNNMQRPNVHINMFNLLFLGGADRYHAQ